MMILELLVSVGFADVGTRYVVAIDAGHGADGADGNVSVRCEAEMDHTFRVAVHLAHALEATGRFRTVLTRGSGERVELHERVRRAEAAGADAFVSIHSDWRSGGTPVAVAYDGRACLRNEDAPGYSVLFSMDAEPPLMDLRQDLARAVARGMAAAGHVPYDGADYGRLYWADDTPGVFIDRRGLVVLRRPTMPSVIVETHHALDTDETDLWTRRETLDGFARVIETALLETLPAH